MALVTKGRTFVSGEVVTPTKLNTLVDSATVTQIVDADISATAAIADTKLATISTAGKVANSATTATNANTASAIVARDASGNFSAGTITASLNGNATSASALLSGAISAQAATKTNTQVGGTGAGTETDITGLSLSVVVPSATAKVLLMGYVTQSGLYVGYRIKRNGTDVALGDAAGTRTRVLISGGYEAASGNTASTIPISYLDSPNASGTFTYKVTGVCAFSNYSPLINRSENDADVTYSSRGTSQLIALVIP